MPVADPLVPALHNIATRFRIESIRATTAAGNGHPSTCCSAAEIVATLFFAEMRFDPKRPQYPDNDRFVLSKGHAAPLLYAAWAEAGAFDRAELLTLRQIGSDLEGHPTPRLPFVDVATGSLGQGICAAVGIALNARRIGSAYRTYVLIGDGESAEGSVWEAANVAEHHKLSNLCGITDVNALGQSQATAWGHDMKAYARRWDAFGWSAIVVDGHDIEALLAAFDRARRTTDRPTMILARTIKGRGVSFIEGLNGWHGRPLKKDEEARAIAELEAQFVPEGGGRDAAPPIIQAPPERSGLSDPAGRPEFAPPAFKLGESIATREAYGAALVKLGESDPRVVVLDADVKNSTFSEKFEKVFAGRFYQNFIAEQAMLGLAMGLASRGAIAFPSTFACFLTRAYDFIRMAAISRLNVKIAGSHAGVSIGEDGPSQMALEDLAMMRAEPNVAVLYPCDAVSTEQLVIEAAYREGPAYIRTSRPKTPVIYGPGERFPIGGCKVLRESARDVATVVAAGVTLFEALKAYDELKAAGIAIRVIDLYSVQPIDDTTLRKAAAETHGRLVTVEDHYPGGGIGDAVAAATTGLATVHVLAVRDIPRSGKPEELLDRFGISARHIVEMVRTIAGLRRDNRMAAEVALQRRFYAEDVQTICNIRTGALVEALATVPREAFLAPGPWMIRGEGDIGGPPRQTPDADPRHVYHNMSVAIDPARQLYNGAPGVVSMCIDALGLKAGERVLHVGCGLGYYSALIAHCVGPTGRVTAIDVDASLAEDARRRLAAYSQVDVRHGNGVDGLAGESYDAILVSAGTTHPHEAWLDALGTGGRMAFPLTFTVEQMGPIGKGVVTLLTRTGDGAFDARVVTMVAIYSAVGIRDAALNEQLKQAFLRGAWPTFRRLRFDAHESGPSCWLHGNGFCLSA